MTILQEDVAEKFNKEQPLNQGTADSGWILLDYGSVIVHIMTPQMKNFYKLERKWKDGEFVDLTRILDQLPTNSGRASPDETWAVASSGGGGGGDDWDGDDWSPEDEDDGKRSQVYEEEEEEEYDDDGDEDEEEEEE